MKSIKKLKINKNSSIKKALKVIDRGVMQIALVVDKKDKLIGTLSDGDIRRGFLKGLNINSSIISLINKKPLVGTENDNKSKLLMLAYIKKINVIPIIDKKRKVVEILSATQLSKEKIKLNKIIIMAGGKGTRLMPLTRNIPKPMLKVKGKPILQKIIENFKDCGFNDIIICINHKGRIIQDYFRNGSRLGVNIEYIKEKKRFGTAGALSLIKKKLTTPFFVINGDLITNLKFEKMLDYHKKNNAIATMAIKEQSINCAYGEVKLNNEHILSVIEKPEHKFFINAGIYILNPECTQLVPKKFFDMPDLFKKMILKKKKIISFPLKENWNDIGTLKDYNGAQK